MKTLKLFTLLGMLFCVSTFTAQQNGSIASGTQIPMRFISNISSDDKLEPQVVVASNVSDPNGNVVITAGSFVRTSVQKVASTNNGTKGGDITVRFLSTSAVDGQTIELSGSHNVQGQGNFAGNFIAVNGKPLKGKPAVIEEETLIYNVITTKAYQVKVANQNATYETLESEDVENLQESDLEGYTTKAITSANLNQYIGKTFGDGDLFVYSFLKLNTDNTYVYAEVANGGVWAVNTGNFKLNNGKIHLTATRCYNVEGNEPTGKENAPNENCDSENSGLSFQGYRNEVSILSSEHSLYFTEYVRMKGSLGSRMYGVVGTELPAGLERESEGVPIITTGYRKGKTKVAVKLRSTPSVAASQAKCYTEDVFEEEVSQIPAGESVITLGRTKNKEKVGTVEDYWYLVEPEYFLCSIWVHGQYLQLEEEAK